MFTGLTDGDNADFLTVLGFHFIDHGIVSQHAQAVVLGDFYTILVDENLIQAVCFRFAFQNNGGIPQPTQHLGRLPAGIGLLDSPGQRAFATDGNSTGHGRRGTAEQSWRDD